MKKINTALFCIFVLLFCSCDVLNKAPLDEIADDSFWSDETLVKYYVNDLYSEISVDGLQLQENRSDNSVSAQRDKYRASWFKFNYDMVSASDPQDDDVWEDYYVKVRKCNRFVIIRYVRYVGLFTRDKEAAGNKAANQYRNYFIHNHAIFKM